MGTPLPQESQVAQQAADGGHTYTHSRATRIWRVCLLLLGAGACAGWVWLLASCYNDPELSGKVVFLALLSPAVLVWGLPDAYRGIRSIGATLTRYSLSPAGLTLRGPFSRRHVPWDRIADCELPRRINRPPNRIVLHRDNGPAITMALDLGRPGRLRAELEAYLPMLGPGDTQRVRLSRHGGPDVIRRQRRARITEAVGALYVAVVLGGLVLLAGLMSGWEYFNYRRIIGDPVEVPGTVLEIDKGEKLCHARVRYDVDDRTFRMHRSVWASFATEMKEGDPVTIQYLRGSPRVARIKGWDMDSRAWAFLLMCSPMMVLPLGALATTRRKLAGPTRDQQINWSPMAFGDKWLVVMKPVHLETNYATWPQRHEGWLVIRNPGLRSGRQTPTLKSLLKCLSREGIESCLLGDTFLLLSPPQAARYCGWLGRDPKLQGVYYVLDGLAADEAEAFVLEYFADDQPPDDPGHRDEEPLWRTLRFMCLNPSVGPFTREEVLPALTDALRAGLERFAYLEPEPDLLEADLAPVLRLLRPDDRVRLLIRHRHGYEILVARNDEDWAERFCLAQDQWQQADPVALPATMRNTDRFRLLIWVLAAPVGIIAWVVTTLFAPLIKAEQRSRRKKLKKERASRSR